MIETLITFIIIFGIIVAIHEYGHLWWAKRSGILVREYAVGMGEDFCSSSKRWNALHDSDFTTWGLCSFGRLG